MNKPALENTLHQCDCSKCGEQFLSRIGDADTCGRCKAVLARLAGAKRARGIDKRLGVHSAFLTEEEPSV